MSAFVPVTPESAAWPYLAAFADGAKTLFVEYLSIGADKSVSGTQYTRKAFMKLALKGAGVLKGSGLEVGDSCVHYFTDNRFEDLVYRVAAVIAGTVPVTVNWQADTVERSLYKAEVTGSKLVLLDGGVPAAFREQLRVPSVDAAAALADDALAPCDPPQLPPRQPMPCRPRGRRCSHS